MKQRILTGLILAPLAIAFILFSSPPVFAGGLMIVWAVAMWEWTRLIGMPSIGLRILATGVGLAVLAGLWLVRDEWFWWLAIVAGVLWWLVAVAWMRHFSFAASPTARNRRIKLLAGGFVLLPAWVALIEIHEQPGLGATWTLFALALIWFADSFAYFAGSRFGRNKLAPRISPGKTFEGVWGALIGTSLVAIAGGLWLGERGAPLLFLVVLALICVIYSIIGDLFESLMKRQASVKDSGTLFPGHGGMLDRLDGIFAAIPTFAVGKLLIDLLLPG